MQVVGMSPPAERLGTDTLVWGLEPNGLFSIRSAYLMITDNAAAPSDSVWSRVLPQAIVLRTNNNDFDSRWRAMLSNKDYNIHFGIIAWSLWKARNKLIFDGVNQSTLEIAEQCNIGDCLITRAELGAIVQGLKLAWSIGIRKILIQSDSRTAVSILQGGEINHQHVAFISEFLELKSRSWDVSIMHIYRAANCVADYLANFGHSCSFGMHFISYPDIYLARWLRYDLVGVALPRAVST
ncbi:Putative ribonuclease H protein At1g65750 [Linum perenne]